VKISRCASFDPLCPAWTDVLARSGTPHLFSAWEWQSTWWAAYGGGTSTDGASGDAAKTLWLWTFSDDDGRLLGILPCFVDLWAAVDTTVDATAADASAPAAPRRVLRLVGCVDVTDYVDVLVDPASAADVYAAMADVLAEHRAEYDLIDFCNIPQHSPTRQHLAAALTAHGYSVTEQAQEVCPIIALPTDFETYLDSLDKKQRHELRRKLRRVEGADEKVTWHIVGANDDLSAATQQFIDLMAASSPDKAAFLQNPQHVAFFRAMVPVMAARGWLQMAFFHVDGVATAAYLNFLYDKQVLVYNSGLATEGYGHLSPGIVLLCYLIEHAIQHGYSHFDFLRGNEGYKYRMGAQDTTVYNLIAQLPTA
jgi:CelD/BcsL family acetyltransferase involved in cellulose biosynthesis